MTTLTLWLVIYLAVGYLINAATADEDDTPGVIFVMTALWPLPVFTIILLKASIGIVEAINWMCEKAGYDWKE